MIRKLERQIRSAVLKPRLSGRFDEDKALVISSTPRSGSTLLSQVLGSIPNSCTLFEPLHLDNVPQAAEAGFSWRTYLPPEEVWPEGKAYLRRVFKGKVLNGWTVREISYRDGSKSDLLLVKFVRANRLFPWMCRQFDLPAPILLMRHPCAVISSQLGYGWKGKERPALPTYLEAYPRFLDAYARLKPGVEYLAAKWAFDQMAVLMEPHPHPWMIVTYEELVRRPEETLTRIASRWKVEIDIEQALMKLNTPSSVVSGITQTISGINGWRQKLSADQISQILTTVNAFGITFYREDLEADYEMLHASGLSEKIKSTGSE